MPLLALALSLLAEPPVLPTDGTLTTTVTTVDGRPIEGATASLGWFGTSDGSSYQWPDAAGDPPNGTTDRRGRVALPFLRSEPSSGLAVTAVAVRVSHPDHVASELREDVTGTPPFAATRVLRPGLRFKLRPTLDGRPVDSEAVRVRQYRGAFPADVAAEVVPGGVRTHAVDPDAGPLRLTLADGSAFSGLISTKAGADQTVSLAAGRPVRGRLTGVDGPVRRGYVDAFLTVADERTGALLLGRAGAAVAEDGTFTVPHVPPEADLQITAICEGFASAPPGPAAHAAAAERYNEPADATGRELFAVPQVHSSESTAAVAMRPTVGVAVRVLNADGSPAAGVTVGTTPNISPLGLGAFAFANLGSKLGYNTKAPPFPWKAVTDTDGRCVIEDVPPGIHLFEVRLGDWRDGTAVDLPADGELRFEVTPADPPRVIRLRG